MRGRYASLLMLHPVALLGLTLLVFNDHVLKRSHPGVLTGKLSDIAGLIVFPLMILAVLDLIVSLKRRRRRLVAGLVITVCAVVFVGIQISTPLGEAYRYVLGALQFPFRALTGAESIAPVQHTPDASDVLALPALMVAWRIASRGDQDRSERFSLLMSKPDFSNRLRNAGAGSRN